mmetsp:Transcript_78232/g.142336  ORF Transcript_78232/g.142336 Transcript_78232/m.142336 type:complete len:396 (+) Transcript_78232:26-1213(+)
MPTPPASFDMEDSTPPPPTPEFEVDTAVLVGLKQLRIMKRKVAPPAAHQVQLSMNCVGICGSDMAYWAKGLAGGFVPLDFSEKGLSQGYCGRLGHESAGTVLRVGDDVTNLKVGDRVALEPGVPCGACKVCRQGRYNLCPKMQFIGSAVNRVPGAMCKVFNHAADYCYKLPPHVSLAEGAMLEPMCVSLQAVTRAKVGLGQNVLVSGAGPIGLMTMLCAKAAGAATVTITDMVDAKLRKAVELGAEYPMRADADNILEKMEAQVGEKFDVCFECCGVPSALNLCVRATASGGTVCVVANFSDSTPLRLQEAARREIDIIGVYRYCNLYPTALSLVSSGKVNLKPLISRRFSLDQVNEAFEHFASGEPIKVIIQPNEPDEESRDEVDEPPSKRRAV